MPSGVRARSGTQTNLFDSDRSAAGARTVVTVTCAGCGSTAGRASQARGAMLPDRLPHDWQASWAGRSGGLALWCRQCFLEGRMDRNQQREDR
jgi:hypothetical protein